MQEKLLHMQEKRLLLPPLPLLTSHAVVQMLQNIHCSSKIRLPSPCDFGVLCSLRMRYPGPRPTNGRNPFLPFFLHDVVLPEEMLEPTSVPFSFDHGLPLNNNTEQTRSHFPFLFPVTSVTSPPSESKLITPILSYDFPCGGRSP